MSKGATSSASCSRLRPGTRLAAAGHGRVCLAQFKRPGGSGSPGPVGSSTVPNDSDLPSGFLAAKARMTQRYLHHDDPRLQSGFGGGAERWENERRPILTPVTRSGTILDLGCANGHLLECLVAWAAEAGVELVPYGVDQDPALIELARERLPAFSAHFFSANVWSWAAPRRFTYVYSLADVVPPEFLSRYLRRLYEQLVEPGGVLIVGSYGSHSREEAPLPLEKLLPDFGLPLSGSVRAGPGRVVAFAWSNTATA